MPRACVPRGKNSPVRLAAHNECRQSAKPTRSCGDSPRRGEPCSLPDFAGSTVVPRSQPRNIFRARLAKAGRPNQKPCKIQRSFAGFYGAFSFCLENDGRKVRRAARSRGRHGPMKAPAGAGQQAQKVPPVPSIFVTSASVLSKGLQNARFCVMIASRNAKQEICTKRPAGQQTTAFPASVLCGADVFLYKKEPLCLYP